MSSTSVWEIVVLLAPMSSCCPSLKCHRMDHLMPLPNFRPPLLKYLKHIQKNTRTVRKKPHPHPTSTPFFCRVPRPAACSPELCIKLFTVSTKFAAPHERTNIKQKRLYQRFVVQLLQVRRSNKPILYFLMVYCFHLHLLAGQ